MRAAGVNAIAMPAATASAVNKYIAASIPVWAATMPAANEPRGMTPQTAKRKIAFIRPSMSGIPLSHTIALGASNNDVEAVATAALGISIGDDCKTLVDVADIVAPSVSEDGLAWALRAAGLTTVERTGGQGLGDAR